MERFRILRDRCTLIFTALCLMTAGCGSALSRQVIDEVDRAVKFDQLIKDPGLYKGRMVLLGGRILKTTLREGDTWVEVLQLPLGWRDKPKDTDKSTGRFLIHHKGFLDPAVYASGMGITVAGVVEGERRLPLDEITYVYPVVRFRDGNLWQPEVFYPSGFSIGIGLGAIFD